MFLLQTATTKNLFYFKKTKTPQKKKKWPAELNAALQSKVNLSLIELTYRMINVANTTDPWDWTRTGDPMTSFHHSPSGCGGQRKWEMEREAAHSAGLRLGLDAEETGCKSNLPSNSPWAFGERVTSLLQLHQFWNGNRSFFFRRMLGGRAG